MDIVIQTITLNAIPFSLTFNEKDRPFISANNHTYTTKNLNKFFNDFPFLLNSKNLNPTVKLINFLLTGIEFQCIEDIEAFKVDYENRIHLETVSLNEYEKNMLSQHGIYDVSSIRAPLIDHQHLMFFVKDHYTHIPYKVSLKIDPLDHDHQARYELLPPALRSCNKT